MNFQRPFICVILKAYLMGNYVGYYCINFAFKYCNVFIHQIEYTYDARRCLLPPGSNSNFHVKKGLFSMPCMVVLEILSVHELI